MKTLEWSGRIKNSIFIVMLIAVTLLITSCSKKIPFLISSVVPSAEGVVKIKTDNNKNYSIELSVERLVDPTRLTPAKLGYVVWMETEGNGVKNIGQLETSTGFMSKMLKSSLTTVTPFKPIGFFITAEDNLQTSYPGSVVALKTAGFSMR